MSCATSQSLLISSDGTPLTKSYALLTYSLSLFSKSRYKCLFATSFLTELKRILFFSIKPGILSSARIPQCLYYRILQLKTIKITIKTVQLKLNIHGIRGK